MSRTAPAPRRAPMPRSTATPRITATLRGTATLRAAALGALLVFLPAGGHARQGDSLFDDLGGRDGLSRIVTASMRVWLADDRIRATFDESDTGRLGRLLVDQLCQLSGGGCVYRGQDMARAHRGLHLRTAQFNAMAEDMQGAMERLGIASATQNRLVALLAPMHRDVVTR